EHSPAADAVAVPLLPPLHETEAEYADAVRLLQGFKVREQVTIKLRSLSPVPVLEIVVVLLALPIQTTDAQTVLPLATVLCKLKEALLLATHFDVLVSTKVPTLY